MLVGALTGIAAFFGLVMNLNYLLAGTVSTNPILGVVAILVILAWRIAGYYEVDRYLSPCLAHLGQDHSRKNHLSANQTTCAKFPNGKRT